MHHEGGSFLRPRAFLEVSRVRPSQKSSPLFSSWRDLSSRGPGWNTFRAAGRKNAGRNAYVFFWWRTACNTWQYLVSGLWSPAGNRGVFPCAQPLPFAANGSGGHAEAERGHTEDVAGALPCASPSAPSYPRSRGVPTRVDFLQITLGRVWRSTVGAPTFVCVIMRKMSGYFYGIRNGNSR